MKAAPAHSYPPEAAEPSVGRNAAWVPKTMIGLLAVTCYLAFGYLDEHGGRFDPLVYEPLRSTNDLAAFHPRVEEDVVMVKGKTIYNRICLPCHMDNGQGDPTRFIPPLAGSEWVNAAGPNRIIRIVLHGLNGPITVKGQTYSGTAMLAWKDILSDEDIALALTYTRSQWGNKAPPVTLEQVKKIRAATADRSDNWSPDELLKIAEGD